MPDDCSGVVQELPSWQFNDNITDSWCDPSIFDGDFRQDLQCPGFMPEMVRNMTVYYKCITKTTINVI
jgi:hypothetical protein